MSSPTTTGQRAAGALRAEMARQRKTGLDLARLLNCSQSSASRRMTGETVLDLDELGRIAEWLDVPLVTLLPAADNRIAA